MEAIKTRERAFVESNYNMRSVLGVLFNSDFFKSESVRFAKVKSPTEVVISTMRLVGDFKSPKPGLFPIAMEIRYMGQDLMNPPTVEGWHTGREWIDSGTLVERINFVSDQVGNIDLEVGWEKWTPKSDKLERRRCQHEEGPARKGHRGIPRGSSKVGIGRASVIARGRASVVLTTIDIEVLGEAI